ncbi:hypothetical protein ACQP60_08610 [Isoptericola variabilis]|uniref:hypothetical protein n=1 Tax=Isoptericola variabilis TaxID=139208 RepID=UPI003D1A678E
MLDAQTLARIHEAAVRKADEAPPLTPHQQAVIKAMFSGQSIVAARPATTSATTSAPANGGDHS